MQGGSDIPARLRLDGRGGLHRQGVLPLYAIRCVPHGMAIVVWSANSQRIWTLNDVHGCWLLSFLPILPTQKHQLVVHRCIRLQLRWTSRCKCLGVGCLENLLVIFQVGMSRLRLVLLQARWSEESRANLRRLITVSRTAVVLRLYQVEMATLVLLNNFVLRRGPLNELLQGAEGGNFGELGIVPGDWLDESAQVRPRHSEHERPVILRVQVAVRQDKQALVRLRSQLVSHDHIEQVLSVELLPLGVQAHASFDQLIHFQVLKV